MWHHCKKGGSVETVEKMRFGIGRMRNPHDKQPEVVAMLPGGPVWACSACGRTWGRKP